LGPINTHVNHMVQNFLCAAPIAFIMFYVARYDGLFTRLMSSRLLVALGETSYSIYLIHSWTLRIFFRPPPEWNWIWGLETIARIVIGILFTLLVAKATYDLIEVPSRVWLRATLGRAIAATFDRRSKRQIPPKNSGRQWGAVPGLALSPARRATFSIAAIGALAVTAVVGHAAQSDGLWKKARWLWVGTRAEIEVVSASYGLSCKDFKVPAGARNTVAEGNVTKLLKRACDMSDECEFLVDAQRIGDPAQGCGKDFSVEYRCTDSPASRSRYMPGEAHGARVALSCRPESLDKEAAPPRISTRSGIEVLSASYGLSCKDFTVPAGAKNTVAEGNVTNILKRACDMSDECEFLVDAQRIGDPAQGCGKDFSVEYSCANSPAPRSIYVSGEAHENRVTLSCRTDGRDKDSPSQR
jgi:hypothetical protein